MVDKTNSTNSYLKLIYPLKKRGRRIGMGGRTKKK